MSYILQPVGLVSRHNTHCIYECLDLHANGCEHGPVVSALYQMLSGTVVSSQQIFEQVNKITREKLKGDRSVVSSYCSAAIINAIDFRLHHWGDVTCIELMPRENTYVRAMPVNIPHVIARDTTQRLSMYLNPYDYSDYLRGASPPINRDQRVVTTWLGLCNYDEKKMFGNIYDSSNEATLNRGALGWLLCTNGFITALQNTTPNANVLEYIETHYHQIETLTRSHKVAPLYFSYIGNPNNVSPVIRKIL